MYVGFYQYREGGRLWRCTIECSSYETAKELVRRRHPGKRIELTEVKDVPPAVRQSDRKEAN